MTIDDATLLAYADGVLSPDDARTVERALATDAAMGERLRLLRDGGRAVRDAYAYAFTAPVPARLSALLRNGPPRRAPWLRRRWVAITAASACALAVGLFAGRELPQRDGEVRLAAATGAASALDDASALALVMALEGASPVPGSPRVSVLGDVDAGLGVPCRRFQVAPPAGARGLACRGANGAWSLLVLPDPQP